MYDTFSIPKKDYDKIIKDVANLPIGTIVSFPSGKPVVGSNKGKK